MRPYHAYRPDQAFLLPPALTDLIAPDDPVHVVRQVLQLCRAAGLVRLGHVSMDGTKVRANASKHKAMSYGRMVEKERELEEEIQRWLEEGERQDAEEDEAYGPEDD